MAIGDKRFEDLNIPELKGVASSFAVDLDGKTKKTDIISEIKSMGVTWEMYQALIVPEDDEIEIIETIEETEEPVVAFEEPLFVEELVVEEEDVDLPVLIKMTRPNFSYEVRGYKFTRQHPIALVDSETADYLIEEDGGFRPVSPKETREFYAQ